MCKRLIDLGRIDFLQRNGFDARLQARMLWWDGVTFVDAIRVCSCMCRRTSHWRTSF